MPKSNKRRKKPSRGGSSEALTLFDENLRPEAGVSRQSFKTHIAKKLQGFALKFWDNTCSEMEIAVRKKNLLVTLSLLTEFIISDHSFRQLHYKDIWKKNGVVGDDILPDEEQRTSLRQSMILKTSHAHSWLRQDAKRMVTYAAMSAEDFEEHHLLKLSPEREIEEAYTTQASIYYAWIKKKYG